MNIQLLVGVISFGITVILSLFIIPYLKKLKVGQVVRTDGPETHLKKSGTPTMGGIMIILSVLLILAIFAFKKNIIICSKYYVAIIITIGMQHTIIAKNIIYNSAI